MYKLEDYTNITNTLEMVTPDMATAWLLLNREENRNIKKAEIKGIATDIRNGNWTIDNNSICFDTNGKLCDGQNRLHAIIEAGVSAPCFVRRGLDPKAMQTIDGGAGRSLNDRIRISGANKDSVSLGCTQVDSIIKAAYEILHGVTGTKMTVAETVSLYNRFSNTFDLVYHICCCTPGRYSSAVVKNRFTCMAVLAALCNGVSERRCRAFVDCLVKSNADDAIFLGCNFNAAVQYNNSYAKKLSGRSATKERYSIANRAIYYFAECKTRTSAPMPYTIDETKLAWLEGRLEKRKDEIYA